MFLWLSHAGYDFVDAAFITADETNQPQDWKQKCTLIWR